jgi:branched-chain amino acid transport system ATP-binding protein
MMLSARGLTAGYGGLSVLRSLDLNVHAGEWLTLLGPLGAGKSTLFGILAGLLKMDRGEITLEGEPIGSLPAHQRLRRGLALVPEGRRLFAGMTVRENLRAGAQTLNDAASFRRNLDQVLALFPVLHERHSQLAGTLSGGEQQMCAIGRALMASPRLLLIDEVTLGLAPLVSQQLFAALSTLHSLGLTLLTVEQNVPMALSHADRGCLLSAGSVVLEGPAAALRADPELNRRFLELEPARR